jgi:hypothetical protein
MTTLPAQLSTLDQQISAIADRLRPPVEEFVALELDRLKAGGMLIPRGIMVNDFLSEYMEALDGVPAVGLALAVAKLKRGEYPDMKFDFMPVPAKLAQLARNEAMESRKDIARLRQMRDQIAERIPKDRPDKAEQDRQLARIRQLHAGFKAFQVANQAINANPDQLDSESVEYWTRLAALNDAGEISAEQAAFRRSIANACHEAARTDDFEEFPEKTPQRPKRPSAGKFEGRTHDHVK